ncbi:MAG: AraC family transcriptional regulator, partial [Rubrobacteraceae bacterium]
CCAQTMPNGGRSNGSAIPTGDIMGFVFDERSVNSSMVEMVWRTRSEHAGTFTSVAASNWEMVITSVDGETMITARGPETKASQADFPADAEFFGIVFKLGTFMPHLPVKALRDRQDATLPRTSSNCFWLHGSVWELPTFENADVFVDRLVRQEVLVRDPVVEAAMRGCAPEMSIRSLQYRFLRATGLTHKTIRQIERVRSAASLLERGTRISDAAFELGYFDQAHLTNSLRRFIGRTPAQITRKNTA